MNNKKMQHVVPHADGWAVKRGSSHKATKVFSTQKKALERAREIAINQGNEVCTHGKNGQIRQKNSYGNDPSDIPG